MVIDVIDPKRVKFDEEQGFINSNDFHFYVI